MSVSASIYRHPCWFFSPVPSIKRRENIFEHILTRISVLCRKANLAMSYQKTAVYDLHRTKLPIYFVQPLPAARIVSVSIGDAIEPKPRSPSVFYPNPCRHKESHEVCSVGEKRANSSLLADSGEGEYRLQRKNKGILSEKWEMICMIVCVESSYLRTK